jgi:hypothetical protein
VEQYRIVFENYLGYYIYGYSNYDNIIILKLSFQDHLILQRIFIENNKLIEGNKIHLKQVINYGSGIKIFIEDGVEFDHYSYWANVKKPFVVYNPNKSHIGIIFRFIVYIHYGIEPYGSITILDFENSFFTKNSSEIINIVTNRLFSPSDEQRKYIGIFEFSNYEIVNIENIEIPFSESEIKNDQIVVEADRQYLFGKHISTYHTNWCGMVSINGNGQASLGGVYLDGLNWFSDIKYYYVDFDTIIYEYIRGEMDNDEEKYIKYKIVFKRKNISE